MKIIRQKVESKQVFRDKYSRRLSEENRLSASDKEEVKKVLQNTDDPETIAAVLAVKSGKKNEELDETSPVKCSVIISDGEKEEIFEECDSIIEAEDICNSYAWKFLDPVTGQIWDMSYRENDVLQEATYDECTKTKKSTKKEDRIIEDVNDDYISVFEEESIEDILEGPKPGIESGVADLILSLINDENEAIQGYISFKASLGDIEQKEAYEQIIDDIMNEEMNHIGMLQMLLKQVSPNTEIIAQGEEEAEDVLSDYE